MTVKSLLVKIGADVSELQSKLRTAETTLKNHQKTFEKVGKRMNSVGKSLTKYITLPILGISGAAFKMSTDFNKAMANVATLIPGNIKRIKELKTGVQDLAISVGKSTRDLGEGLYQVISALGDTQDSLDILEISAKAATAGVATTTDSINLLTAVMKGYGNVSKEAAQKSADLAFQTVKLGQTTFPELAASIGAVTPIAAALNVAQEELFAGFATLTGVTGDAANVSTQLKAVMSEMMKPSEDLQKAMKKLGYANAETMIKEKGLIKSLRLLIGTTDGSTTAVGKLFNNVRSLPAVFALTGGQAEVFDEKLAQMKKSAGAMNEAFKEQTETVNKVGFTWAQLKAEIEVTAERLGDALAPVFKAGLDFIRPFIGTVEQLIAIFSKLPKPVQASIVGFTGLVAATGPVLAISGKLISSIPAIVSGFNFMFGAGVRLTGSLVKLGGSVGSLITKLGGLQTMTLAAGAAFAGWKIGRFIGNLEIAGKTIDERITDKLGKAIEKLGLFGSKAELAAGHTQALTKQQQLLADASKLVGKDITNVHEAIKILKQHYYETGEMASEVMKNWKLDHEEAKTSTQNLKDKVDEVKETVKVTTQVIETHIEAVNGVIDKTKWWKTELIEIPTIMENVRDAIEDGFVKTAIPAANDFSDVLGQVPDKFESLAIKAKEKTEEVENIFVQVSQRIKDAWTRELGEMLSGAESFKEGLSAIWNEIKRQFFDVLAKMITEWTVNFANKVLASVKNIGSEIAKSIGGAAKFGTSMIKTAASATSSLLSSVNTLGIVATAVASIFNLFKKSADLTYTNNLLEEQNWVYLTAINQKLDDVNGKLAGIWKDFGSLMKRVNDIADGINALVKKMKGYAGGGYVQRPQLAMVGEAGPEFIIPKKDLNAFLSSMGGGITLKQSVVFNGNISSNLDIEAISRKLAERTLQAIQRGRGLR